MPPGLQVIKMYSSGLQIGFFTGVVLLFSVD